MLAVLFSAVLAVGNSDEALGYRLGDMFWYPGQRAYNTTGERNRGYAYHLKHWPNSLAVAYMNRTQAAGDFTVLESIVKERAGKLCGSTPCSPAPPPHSLVVHLRAGDVLDRSAVPLREHLAQYQPLCWNWDAVKSDPAHLVPGTMGFVYVQPLSYYEDLVIPHGTTEVELVTSLKVRPADRLGAGVAEESKSRQYLEAVQRVFVSRGLRVTQRVGGPPDEAFMYMAQSKAFAPSGGGFSHLLAEMVSHAGGLVLGEPVMFMNPFLAFSKCVQYYPFIELSQALLARILAPLAATTLVLFALAGGLKYYTYTVSLAQQRWRDSGVTNEKMPLLPAV